MSSDPDTGKSRHVPRPRSRSIPVLDGIRVSWEWLCAAPHPVCIDGTLIDGLADQSLPLDEVRARLLDRDCPLPVRDAVWAHLIGRSRADGSTWTVACAGMALPMLAAVCRNLCGGRGVDRDDVSSAVVTGFVAALARLDLDRPGLATSLRWAAIRAGHDVLREQRRAPHPVSHDRLVRAVLTHSTITHTALSAAPGGSDRDDAGDGDRGTGLASVGRWESAPPPTVGGHPDIVLADAVADGVLTVAEAALIGETRLESTTLAQAAARRGRTVGAVTMQRLRAEMRLVDHLRNPDHHDATPDHAEETGTRRRESGGGRGRARSRNVTGQRPPSAAVRDPRRGHQKSPSVTTTRRRRGGPAHDCDGQVTR